MGIFRKIRGVEAQHTIEYAVLLTLIMAGIIIAGPYVVRSWNANLKGWDDSVQDSLQDQLLEVSPAATPIQGCNPQSWNDQGCGSGTLDPCTGTTFSCSPQEMLRTRTYSPPGCQCTLPGVSTVDYLDCQTNDSNHCCTPWLPISPTIADCGANASPPCPDGEYRATHVCDSGYAETNCFPDPICVFSCTSPPFVPATVEYGSMCVGDNTGLSSDFMNSFVLDGDCTATKCETQCSVGYFALGSGAGAYCGPCGVTGIPRASCTFPRFERGGCTVGRFRACCHTP